MPAPRYTGDDNRVSNSTARLVSVIAIPLAVITALVMIYLTMFADPGSRPANDPPRESKSSSQGER